MNEKELKREEVINHEEIELLVYSLVTDAEYHPYAIYGLMFLFGSIKKALEAGNNSDIENICLSVLVKIYSLSDNGYEAINRVTRNIHTVYRAADFKNTNQREISDAFVKSECFESTEKEDENILDLSEQPNECQHLNSLASRLSEVMKNPNLPTRIYNLLSDEFAEVRDTSDSPENILINLKSLRQAESGGGDGK
jgi:hypothetical protein